MSNDLIVFVEHDGTELNRVSRELTSQASRVARASGGKVHAVGLGRGAESLVSALGDHGVDVAHVSSAEILMTF